MPDLLLSDDDQAMLDGVLGKGPQVAMRILTRMAKLQGATELLDISQVHIGGSIYTGPGSLTVIERFVDYGARVKVPTTLNAMSVDKRRWREQHIDKAFATKAIQLADAYEALGAQPMYSCTPYVYPSAPQAGEDIVWAESNAITYANSVLGARTNRHGDFFDVCAAITGRAPKTGLHVSENRRGTFLVEVPPLAETDPAFFTALGYIIGQYAAGLVPVVDGLRSVPSTEDLKALCAAISTSGPVGLVHVVGVTPEAGTREIALGGKQPLQSMRVTEQMLLDTTIDLNSGRGAPSLDLVALGSPHFTLGEFEELARLVEGRVKHPRTKVMVTTSRFTLDQAADRGWAEMVQEFGADIRTDTCLCMLNPLVIPTGTNTVMTSSGKFAHYGPGLLRQDVWYSSLADCVESAVGGIPVVRTPSWATRPRTRSNGW